MKLIEISYEEYQILAESGVWVQWDCRPFWTESVMLHLESSRSKVDPRKLHSNIEEYRFYTRMGA